MPVKRPESYTIKINGKEVTTQFRSIYRILTKVNRGFSPVVLVVGDKGMGKSFCACWLAYYLSKLLGKDFRIDENCAYDLDYTVDFIDKHEKDILILDEMIELAYRREWHKKSHTHFIKILNTQRIKQIIYIMILPYASDLDKSFAKHIDIIYFVKKKGIYIAGSIRKSFYTFDNKNDWARWFEKISVTMSQVPKELWKDYEAYSKAMKTKISERISDEIKAETTPIETESQADMIIKELRRFRLK